MPRRVVERAGLALNAMTDRADRLPRVAAWDRPRAFAAVGEALWLVTIVGVTLVRHRRRPYDGVRAGPSPAERSTVTWPPLVSADVLFGESGPDPGMTWQAGGRHAAQ
jgi:hypothetical protein